SPSPSPVGSPSPSPSSVESPSPSPTSSLPLSPSSPPHAGTNSGKASRRARLEIWIGFVNFMGCSRLEGSVVQTLSKVCANSVSSWHPCASYFPSQFSILAQRSSNLELGL